MALLVERHHVSRASACLFLSRRMVLSVLFFIVQMDIDLKPVSFSARMFVWEGRHTT